MSRNKNIPRKPQRSRREAQQEFRRAVKAGTPTSFGIRRSLSCADDHKLRDIFYDLLLDHDVLSEVIEPREKLHLTLMRRRQLDSQLSRGIVAGYELCRAAARIQSDTRESWPNTMQVELAQARVMNHGRAVVMAVEGDGMRFEAREIMKSMASIGLKGALRNDGFKPHITLGESDKPLSRALKNELIELTSEMLPIGMAIDLMPLEFYPPVDDYTGKRG